MHDISSRMRSGRPPSNGPRAIRTLASASAVYQRVLTDAAAVLHDVIEQSPMQTEAQFAGLLMLMANVEQAIEQLQDQCQRLLGEREEATDDR